MLPNHFPEEMSALQAQDMSKVGAIQDLVYGVKKLLGTTSHESQNVRLDALAMAFDQKEEKERKQKRTVKIIVTAVVCVVLAFFIVRGINSNMASQAKESEEQSYASPYVGRWISSDEENELILNADGTCTFNGESLYWTRDKSLLDGRFSIYVNYGSNMASRSTVANVRTVFSRDGNIRFIQVTVNNTRANPAPEALNSLIKDEKGITTIFGKAE